MDISISVKILWESTDQELFLNREYSREHRWELESGTVLHASSSPHIVPVPYSNPKCIDPEEAFLSSISSCHMLFFLSIAAKKKIAVLQYKDEPIGLLTKNTSNHVAITEVTLQPNVTTKDPVSHDVIEKIHHMAHQHCFIAQSIHSTILIKPQYL